MRKPERLDPLLDLGVHHVTVTHRFGGPPLGKDRLDRPVDGPLLVRTASVLARVTDVTDLSSERLQMARSSTPGTTPPCERCLHRDTRGNGRRSGS